MTGGSRGSVSMIIADISLYTWAQNGDPPPPPPPLLQHPPPLSPPPPPPPQTPLYPSSASTTTRPSVIAASFITGWSSLFTSLPPLQPPLWISTAAATSHSSPSQTLPHEVHASGIAVCISSIVWVQCSLLDGYSLTGTLYHRWNNCIMVWIMK